MRNSARKHAQNQSVKSRLKTLEKKYASLAAAGNKTEAAQAFQEAASAFDKAAKKGVVHPRAVSRKKSRLALRLNKLS